MKKTISYVLSILFVFSTSCSDEKIPEPAFKQTIIQLMRNGFQTRLVDEDNLDSEQIVKNMAIFFTNPSSDVITHKYVDVAFASRDDYEVATLPVDPAELNIKDIYVVTNYSDVDFDALTSIKDLEGMTTPFVDKNNNLDPQKGLCMYGKIYDFDFTANQEIPAIVSVVRTCAKYRITLTFPQNSSLSIDNTYLIANAANYTYIVDNTGNSIPTNAYFNFAKAMPLEDNGNNAYTNVAYVYEATQAPKMYIYTHMNNSSSVQEFSANLPVPERNYLYDIDVRVYEESQRFTRGNSNDETRYRYDVEVTVYDAEGKKQ